MSTPRTGKMRWIRAATLVLSSALAALAAGPTEADASARVQVGKPHRLRVTHTTRVRVEEGAVRLEVTHAKPLPRTWPGMKAPLGVEKERFSPAGAREIATRTEGGQGWAWDMADPAAGESEFVSTFEVLSADRELKTSGLEVRWADLPKDTTELWKGQPAPNEPLRDVVAKIKKKGKDVIDTLTAFTQWVSVNIAYVPGVSYGPNDLEAICRGKAGHCGHRATVFLALCQAAGIPARRVAGFALLNLPPGGAGVDDSNRHVWVEVDLPGIGWVEIEPAPHGSPFAISFQFVLCPIDLQSRFVASHSKAGERSAPVVFDTLRMEEVK